MALLKGPLLAACVTSGTTESQRHPHVWQARSRGPRTPSGVTDGNLDCVFVENSFVFNVLKFFLLPGRVNVVTPGV